MDLGSVVLQLLNELSSLSHCCVSLFPSLDGFWSCNDLWYLLFTTFKCVLVFKFMFENQTRNKHLNGINKPVKSSTGVREEQLSKLISVCLPFPAKKKFPFPYEAGWQLPFSAKIPAMCHKRIILQRTSKVVNLLGGY